MRSFFILHTNRWLCFLFHAGTAHVMTEYDCEMLDSRVTCMITSTITFHQIYNWKQRLFLIMAFFQTVVGRRKAP